MLEKLPNGQWRDRCTVTEISPIPGKGSRPNRVIVVCGTGPHRSESWIEFPDQNAAQAWADAFGDRCNEARSQSKILPAF